jgi:hypothetical protein
VQYETKSQYGVATTNYNKHLSFATFYNNRKKREGDATTMSDEHKQKKKKFAWRFLLEVRPPTGRMQDENEPTIIAYYDYLYVRSVQLVQVPTYIDSIQTHPAGGQAPDRRDDGTEQNVSEEGVIERE